MDAITHNTRGHVIVGIPSLSPSGADVRFLWTVDGVSAFDAGRDVDEERQLVNCNGVIHKLPLKVVEAIQAAHDRSRKPASRNASRSALCPRCHSYCCGDC